MASRLITQTTPSVSPTLAINQLSQSLASSGKEIFRFGFGQSPFPVPDYIVEALKENACQKDYLQTAGLKQLREKVADHFSTKTANHYSWENVIIGPGSKELLFLAQLAEEYTLLLPSPSWVSYAPQAAILHRKTSWLETTEQENYCLQPQTLEAYCRLHPGEKKLLILNSPGNPTGTAYASDLLIQLAAVARKYGVLLISDEIYGQLHFENQHQSIATHYPEGTLITEGLSKWCGAGGWRLGVMIIPDALKEWRDKMISIASETFSCVSAPVQYAALSAYQESAAKNRYLFFCRAMLQAISEYVAQSLNLAQVTCPDGEGGFYLFPNFSHYAPNFYQKGITSSSLMCQRLLQETGVALLPGTAFGRPPEEFTARLAFVDFDGKQALDYWQKKEKESTTEDFLETCCPKIMKGTRELISWLQRDYY